MNTTVNIPAYQGYAAFEAAKAAAIGRLRGTVLEIGAGRRGNFHLLADGVSWLGLEPDEKRGRELARRARAHGHHQSPLRAPAEHIPLPDDSVDAVLAVHALCSVGDPAAVLAEVSRVLRGGGRLVFADHVAAPRGTWKRVVQRVIAPFSRVLDHGCDPTREIADLVDGSALAVTELSHFQVPVLLGATVPCVVGEASAPVQP